MKEGQHLRSQVPAPILSSLIRSVFTSSRVRCYSLTVALDNLPVDNPEATARMVEVAKTTLQTSAWLVPKGIGAIFITANSPHTLVEYARQGIPLEAFNSLSGIQFSHLSERDLFFIQNYISTDVGYNFSPSGPASLTTLRKLLPWLRGPVYLILHKAGLGRRNDPREISRFKDALREIATWEGSEKDKIVVDRCVTDTSRFIRYGQDCRAGLSVVHVWPDGHSTGCPYNQDPGEPKPTVTTILDGILSCIESTRNSGAPDFRRCTIPRDYISSPKLPILF